MRHEWEQNIWLNQNRFEFWPKQEAAPMNIYFFFFKTCLRNTLWKSIVLMKCSVCHFWEQNILSDQNLKKFWSDILLSFTKLEGKNYIVISKFYKLVTKAEYFITKLAKYGTNANFQISIKCFALQGKNYPALW